MSDEQYLQDCQRQLQEDEEYYHEWLDMMNGITNTTMQNQEEKDKWTWHNMQVVNRSI